MGLLDSILGGANTRDTGRGGGMSPITMALLGLLAYRTFHGKGRLAEMLGTSPANQDPNQPATSGGLRGMLSGFLGGSGIGAALSGGLSELLNQFQQNGMGDKIQSWIGTGPNKPIGSSELVNALGEDKIAWLMRETGLSRDQLLSGLSRELPPTVDKLTPEGRIPTEQEAARMA